MNILGISSYYHDSACCLVQNGNLIAAAQEERFSRRKHDRSLPRLSFRYCLEQGGIAIDDIDCVAYYESPAKKLGRQIWSLLAGAPADLQALTSLDPRRLEREIKEILGYDGPLLTVDHHVSHAASSFFASGFEEAAIFTVDGVGEWATTTYGRGSQDGVSIFEEVEFPDSLGLLYSAITSFLGFSVNDGEYKVMGLAPYGSPILSDKVRKLVQSAGRGQYRLDLRYFDFTRVDRMYSDALPELLGQPARKSGSELQQFHKDLARSIQAVLEEVLLDKVRYLHTQVPSRNLCMAGGVALNCVANSRILNDGPFRELFVQPAAGDAGGCLGAAYSAYAQLSGRNPPRRQLAHVCLGPGYSAGEVEQLLKSTGRPYSGFVGREQKLLDAVAERLAAGKVVGWFHGRMEFGPRALGARSILADPRDAGMRDRINGLVKKRESFRPFAPSVLEARAGEHFDLGHPSPFMLETCPVKSRIPLPAITHVDNSARVHTVSSEAAPRFARLLEVFAERTGCPILLNTSFNMKDEPIVCTPLDALLCFVRAELDTLVLDDFIIDRQDINPMWPVLIGGVNEGLSSGISQQVYTFF